MSLKENIDALLQDATANGDVPGVVAMVTNRDETIYEGSFGERVLGSGQVMTPDTIVLIASMTKAITGVAAMQQVEQGKLELDSPASDIIPYLGEVEVLEGFDDADQPITRAPKSTMTLRHLLTHTAGFGYEYWNESIIRYQKVKGIPSIITRENAALKTPLLFDPGERWEYGISIDWVGKIVERVSGKKLGEYMKENIFDPLGMSNTTFKITPDMLENMAKIHHRGDDDSFEPLDLVLQEPELESGGGGLYSTVGDYLKFVKMILNKGATIGHQILKPETVEMMSQNQMGNCRVCELKAALPVFTNDVEFFPGMEKTWGISFMINTEQAPTGRTAGSLAWAGMANSYYWIDLTMRIGGIYATQILPFADKKSLPLYFAFEKAVYNNIS